MTWYDRLLVVVARWLLGRLARRFSTEHERVWWVQTRTYNPRRFVNTWTELPEQWPAEEWAGEVSFSFGTPGPDGLHGNAPPPILDITITRRMLDTLVDGAVEVRHRQDIQLQALRTQRDR
jgi:hypothetical protein